MRNEIIKKVIGDYEIQEKIGSGSFTSVYKAIHQPTQLTVAIKSIHKELLENGKGR
jgi:serine/threonine protein kinase